MEMRNTKTTYGFIAKLLHWVVVLGIVAMIALGLLQDELGKGQLKEDVETLHASVGVLLLVIMIVRLAWRLINVVPAHPEGMPTMQKRIADIAHWGLYALVFVQLGSGVLGLAYDGDPLPFFGLFTVALPFAENHDLHEVFEELHEGGWIALVVLILLHVGGALYNHIVLGNDVLRRMTHGVKRG